LDDLVEDVPGLVDGTPQPVLLASDADDHLIQMPDVFGARLLTTQPADLLRTELLFQAPDCLIRNNDAPLEQHLLDQPEAPRKSEVQPDRMGNNLGREPMALVADGAAHDAALTPEDPDQKLP
jgi:hypothetical protein